MADNALKVPLALSIDAASRQRAGDSHSLVGKDLPCHVTKIENQIATVAFDVKGPWNLPVMQVPIDTGVDDWIPVQVGDKGVVRSVDVYLGGVSGQGTGTADFARRTNLSTLVFHPTTNKQWKPRGKDLSQNDRIVGSRQGKAALVGKNDQKPTYVDENGNLIVYGDIHCMGEIIWKFGSDNTHASTHTHDNVFTGGGDTTKPNQGS